MSADFVYLASGSPRRRELLAQIGVPFQVLSVTVDEARLPGEAPDAYVLRLARQKADAGWRARPLRTPTPVLAADTTVVLDGKILVKPNDRSDAERMLRELGGRTHEVLTAVVVATAQGLISRTSRSEVTFRAISAAEAHDYWATGEPQDKAGGYAIQHGGAMVVNKIEGCFYNVMGLPVSRVVRALRKWEK